MFTLLVTVVVVGLALAGAVAVAVKDPEQPATLRTRKPRARVAKPAVVKPAKRPRVAAGRAPAPVAVGRPTAQLQGADGAGLASAGLLSYWAPAPRGHRVWVRLRSGVVLTFLLTAVGALLALSVAGVIVFIALAVRSAVS